MKLPHQALVADDADVAFDAEFARKSFAEGSEVGEAADGIQFFLLAQMVGDGDDVDTVAHLDQLQHGGIDFAMGVEGEVVGLQQHGRVDDGDGLHQHGAEDGHLGVHGGGPFLVSDDVGKGCHEVLR